MTARRTAPSPSRSSTASTTSCGSPTTGAWPPASRPASTRRSSSAPTSSSTPTPTTSTTAATSPSSSSRSCGGTRTWSSATARSCRSSTSRRSRRRSSGSARGACGGRRRPPGPAPPPGSPPPTPRARRASQPTVPDTPSGFRAYNREAALAMQVVSNYTYTLETIIQAGKMLIAVDHVPIKTNEKLRESRLFPSMWTYIRRNGVSIFRVYSMYEPLRVFMTGAMLIGLVALVVWGRFAYFYVVAGEGKGHVQSLILGAVLFNAAMLLAALGVIGDLLSGQRIMLQRTFERVRRIELELGVPPSHYEPGAGPTGHEPTTGAHSGRRGETEEREALKV